MFAKCTSYWEQAVGLWLCQGIWGSSGYVSSSVWQVVIGEGVNGSLTDQIWGAKWDLKKKKELKEYKIYDMG